VITSSFTGSALYGAKLILKVLGREFEGNPFSKGFPSIDTCKAAVRVPQLTAPFYYSVLRASTGSFLDATLDGISPAMRVSTMLIMISATAPLTGTLATRVSRLVTWWMI